MSGFCSDCGNTLCICSLIAEDEGDTLLVNLKDVETVIDWWRNANEAPGGCSFADAIRGMREAVWNLELTRREQTGDIR